LIHHTRRLEALALGLFLVVTFFCCLPAVDAPFTYDEDAGIEDNRVVHPGASLGEALAYRYSPDQARPVFFASLLLDANLWGMRPRGFRVTCFLLHLACGALLYFLLKRPPGTAGAALAGTSLFLLHPLQSESVLYIWGRSEVLSTLFGLAAMLFVLRSAEREGPGTKGSFYSLWAGAIACMALALASKEEAIAMPVILFLWWTLAEGRPGRQGVKRAAVLAIPVVLFLAVRAIALGGIGRQVYVRSVAENILGQGVVTLRMLRLFLLPFGQSIDHAAGVPGAFRASLALGACAFLLTVAILTAVAASRRAQRAMAASRIAGGVLIAAVASILYWMVPLPDLMCERRLYLPLIGAALSLSGALIASRRRALAVAAALLLLLAPAMALRAGVWADPVRLWGEAARLAPEKARPLINLGVVAAEKGDRTQALDLFSRAIALEPHNAEALFNRGKLHLDAGDSGRAIEDLQIAVASNPILVRARINLGIARIDAGDLAGAEAELRSSLEIEPKNPRALTNLAEVLRATRRADEAVALYRQALEADPTYSHAAARLGVTLENLGDPQGALSAYRDFLVRGTTSPTDRQAVENKVRMLEQAAATGPPKP
jgi:tetratricopeptide (TPR) repeat protein